MALILQISLSHSWWWLCLWYSILRFVCETQYSHEPRSWVCLQCGEKHYVQLSGKQLQYRFVTRDDLGWKVSSCMHSECRWNVWCHFRFCIKHSSRDPWWNAWSNQVKEDSIAQFWLWCFGDETWLTRWIQSWSWVVWLWWSWGSWGDRRCKQSE
jgi:hypothetical protein